MKKLILLLLLIPSILIAGDNPFRDGYHQDTNPFGDGYIQDTNPFADGYVQDKGVFEDNIR